MTKSKKAQLKRLRALERTSSADLEALLLLDFHSQETSDTEIDEILRAAEILAERGPPQDNTRVDRAWETFVEKYLPFADDSSLHESAEALGASALAVQPRPALSPPLRRRMPRYPICCRIARTAACLALCLLLTGSLLLIFSPQTRLALSGWIRELCEPILRTITRP